MAELQASPLCKAAIDAMMSADNGVRSEWQSYLGNLAMVKGGGGEKFWTDSEVYRCAGGNQSLATRLAAAIGADRIKLRTIVRRIDHGASGVRVTLASGEMLGADDVVLAVPPSVWSKIGVEPALPGQLAPQMGTNVKYLMALRGPFWRRAELAPDSAERRSDQLDVAPDGRTEGRRRVDLRLLGRDLRRRRAESGLPPNARPATCASSARSTPACAPTS